MENKIENEVWRDIAGYDGMYQVSDLGRVRSRKSGEWKVLKARKNMKGYLQVILYRNGNKDREQPYVHRLVASAFIPNGDDTKNQINHIDECKQNNRVSNLEYCTAQYNQTYNDLNLRKKNVKRHKLKDLYDPNLSIPKNLEIFRAHGVECCEQTVRRLRKDLGLTKHYRPRKKPN